MLSQEAYICIDGGISQDVGMQLNRMCLVVIAFSKFVPTRCACLQTVLTTTSRLNSIVEQWLPLIFQMNLHAGDVQIHLNDQRQEQQR